MQLSMGATLIQCRGQVYGINHATPGDPALGADPVNAGNAEDAQGQNFSAMAARIANLQFQRQPVVDRAEEAAGFLTKALDGGASLAQGPNAGRGLKAHVQPPRRCAGHGRWGCGNRGFVRKTLAGHDAYSFYRGTKRTDGQCAA